jgi:hypothetical protein
MSALDALRADRGRRLAATGIAVMLGLVLATLHWSGLLVAGALVALPQRSITRGIAAGVGLGGLVVVVWLVLVGTLDLVLSIGQPSMLALGIGLLLPPFGALVRGVV